MSVGAGETVWHLPAGCEAPGRPETARAPAAHRSPSSAATGLRRHRGGLLAGPELPTAGC
eukprot:307248-Lingulodinium_polyedra.AAC.1